MDKSFKCKKRKLRNESLQTLTTWNGVCKKKKELFNFNNKIHEKKAGLILVLLFCNEK